MWEITNVRQIWGQMHEYQVHYGKLFSIVGVIYVRWSETNPNELIFSKIYSSLDGEVTRSVCMILEARQRARAAFTRAQTVSGRVHLFSRLLREFLLGWIIKWVRPGAMHTVYYLIFPAETSRVLILGVLDGLLCNLCPVQQSRDILQGYRREANITR
jgi:hypothetical protein